MQDRDDLLLEALTGLINARFTELKTEIQDVRQEIQDVRQEIQDVRQELKTEIQGVRQELETEIQDVRQETIKTKLYVENVLDKKLNAFYDNTVSISEYNSLKKQVDQNTGDIKDLKKMIS